MRHWKRLIPLVIPGAIAVAYAADRAAVTPTCLRQPQGKQIVEIRHVTDGDTVVDNCGRAIRIIGVDTPEVDTRWGPQATEFTEQWLSPLTAPVTLDICDEQPTDRYGRLLARVVRQDGQDLSLALLRQGWAWPFSLAPCGEAALEADRLAFYNALSDQRGLWEHTSLATYRAADAVSDTTPFVLLKDRVRQVQSKDRFVELVVGRRRHAIHIRIARTRINAFTDAGIDIERLEGKTIRTQGKFYSDPQRRLYVDYPIDLQVLDQDN